MDAVDDLRGDVQGGVEAKGDVGAIEVVVDGFGQPNDVEALLGKQVGGLVGAVAAQGDKAVQAHLLVVVLHGLDLVHLVVANAAHELEGLAAGAQDGPAQL